MIAASLSAVGVRSVWAAGTVATIASIGGTSAVPFTCLGSSAFLLFLAPDSANRLLPTALSYLGVGLVTLLVGTVVPLQAAVAVALGAGFFVLAHPSLRHPPAGALPLILPIEPRDPGAVWTMFLSVLALLLSAASFRCLQSAFGPPAKQGLGDEMGMRPRVGSQPP